MTATILEPSPTMPHAATFSVAPRNSARAARWAVAGLFCLNGLLFATWVSRLPLVQTTHGLGNGALGLVLLAAAFGALLAMPVTGWLLVRFGSFQVTGTAALLYAATLPSLAFAPGIASLVAGLFCFGITHGACDVAMNAQAIEIEKTYRRSIMSSFHAFFSLGGLAGAGLGGWIAALHVPARTHFVAVASAAGLIMVLWTLPHMLSSHPTEPDGRAHDSRKGLALPGAALVALGVVSICVMMGEGAMADWSAIYLRRVLGSTEGVAALGYAAFSVAMAVGRLSGDGLANRFGAVNVVRFGAALATAGLLMAIVGSNSLLALAGFGCVGLGFSAVVPLVFSAAGRLPGTDPNVALSTVTTLGYLGFLVGPPLIGLVAQGAGLRAALALVAAGSLLAVILAPSVRERSR